MNPGDRREQLRERRDELKAELAEVGQPEVELRRERIRERQHQQEREARERQRQIEQEQQRERRYYEEEYIPAMCDSCLNALAANHRDWRKIQEGKLAGCCGRSPATHATAEEWRERARRELERRDGTGAESIEAEATAPGRRLSSRQMLALGAGAAVLYLLFGGTDS